MKLRQEFLRQCFSLPRWKFGLKYKKPLDDFLNIRNKSFDIGNYSGRKIAS